MTKRLEAPRLGLHPPRLDSKGTKLKRRNLYESVFQTLKQAVVRGIVPSGQRLVVSGLARQLGVSRTPVRDALSRLEALGLVRREGGSYAVTGLAPSDVDQIAVARVAIEGTAAALAAARVTGEEIELLRQLARDLDGAVFDDDVDRYRRLHREFHEKVVVFSHNVYLQRTLQSLKDFIEPVWEATAPSRERLNKAREQHGEIVGAIERRDPEATQRVVAHHIRSGMGLIKRALEEESTKLDLRRVLAEVHSLK